MPADVPVTLVFNKCDLAVGLPVADTLAGPPRITISATTGKGIDVLRAHLKQCMGYQTVDVGTISARQRHHESLARARHNVEEAFRQLQDRRAGELVAEELRGAQQALSEITGEFTTDELLRTNIFQLLHRQVSHLIRPRVLHPCSRTRSWWPAGRKPAGTARPDC